MDGKMLDKAGVEALATMPSLDELRAKLVGLVNAPATKLARVSQAPAGRLGTCHSGTGRSIAVGICRTDQKVKAIRRL